MILDYNINIKHTFKPNKLAHMFNSLPDFIQIQLRVLTNLFMLYS